MSGVTSKQNGRSPIVPEGEHHKPRSIYQTAHFGRVYAAYGGVFIVLSVLWGRHRANGSRRRSHMDRTILRGFFLAAVLLVVVGVSAGFVEERLEGTVVKTHLTACSTVPAKAGTCEGTLDLEPQVGEKAERVTVQITRDTVLKKGSRRRSCSSLRGATRWSPMSRRERKRWLPRSWPSPLDTESPPLSRMHPHRGGPTRELIRPPKQSHQRQRLENTGGTR